jgi:hypothetical protein
MGFVIIVVSLFLMGVWEFWGRENLAYEEILVLKEPLRANSVLTEECFATKRVDSPSKEALKPKDKDSLLGMETLQYVAEGVELRHAYFVPAKYRVGGDTGKGIMSISQDWLLSYPQTLARGNTVALFNGNTKVGECVIAHVRDSSNNEVVFSKEDKAIASGSVLYMEVVSDVATLLNIACEAAKGSRFAVISLD